jgi:VIT1/CCC1 family predicted Fe2+/Mn2+ transporter
MDLKQHIEEVHLSHRAGWLRAAVLGANDGIVSTASLVLGVAAAGTTQSGILLAGAAGLVAGAMSMAAGEYVSVSSQADTETADLARESAAIRSDREGEIAELAGIYVSRGLEPALADQVARQLMARDALGAHARDELGLSETLAARPLQAAFTSALTFTAGAALPLLLAVVVPGEFTSHAVAAGSLATLALLGALAARAGGAPVGRSIMRVTFWGAVAMAATMGIGALFGVAV